MNKSVQLVHKIVNTFVIGVLICLFGVLVGCQGNSQEKKIEEIRPQEGISVRDIIRNPVSANETLDTTNLAKITFDQTSIDFGEVKEGDVVKRTFNFTNTGKIPLLITAAKSTCGCTVPDWPKEAIAPGKSGKIDVKFNTDDKPNYQSKPISIFANTYPNKTVVYLKGRVKPKKN